MAQELARRLRETVDREFAALQAITEDLASRPLRAGGWSRKQELGHLLDSATNNRVRFVRASLEPEYSGPTYDGDGWVSLHGYQDVPWATLVDWWRMQNAMLAHLVGRIPDEKLA